MQFDPNAANEFAKAANSEAGKALILPTAQELGKFFGDLANISRFYATDNLERIFTKWAEHRKAEHKGIEQEDIKKVMPLLPAASMQADEVLQERWAALLEAAATGDSEYLPSFGTTLSVLTPEEAKYLDRLWGFAMQPLNYLSEYPPGILPIEDIKLINIFDSTIDTGISAAEVKQFGNQMSPEQHRNYARLLHARTVIEDLLRLGIIGAMHKTQKKRNHVESFQGSLLIPLKESETKLVTSFALTHYGLAFIRAVSPNTKRDI